MEKINAINILNEIKNKIEHENKKQGIDLYRSALIILQKEDTTEVELNNLYRNLCGYLAYGEFTDWEYKKIIELIECFK
ncbi:hypothetical protein [Serratia microhaemolytica]|uniref:hypothetical protein n=1 Tax=Serratia microhaemolytica TaxID=2675110 RepID=UPI000FDEC093|nr:hypothetical protein [Serratia microhaemolytica]